MSENERRRNIDALMNELMESGRVMADGMAELATGENGADMRQSLEENQQPATPRQIEALRDLDAALGIGQQPLPSQVAEDPSTSRAGPAGSSLPLHSPANRDVEHPTSSILQSSNLLNAQQAAGNRLEQNLTNPSLAQASPTPPQSSFPNGQQAANELQQVSVPPGLSLAQANIILLQVASENRQQAALDGVVQRPPSTNWDQMRSGLQASNAQNVQRIERNRRLVHDPQNLGTGPTTVNNNQLDNRNPTQVSAPLREQEGVATYNQGADLSVVGGNGNFLDEDNLLRPLGELSQFNEVHRSNGVHGGYIERNNAPNDTLESMRNATRNEANPVTHLGGTHHQQGLAQQNLTTRNSGSDIPPSSSELNIRTDAFNQPETSALYTMNAAVQLLNQVSAPLAPQIPLEMNTNSAQGIPLPSSEMNIATGAIPQPETSTHQHQLSAEGQLLNELAAPLLPQTPVGMNNPMNAPHQPSTGTNQLNLDNATTQQDEVNPLLPSQLPEGSNNQARNENPAHPPVDHPTLDSANLQGDSLSELDLLPTIGNDVVTGGAERENELGTVSHSEQHSEALQWISNFVRDAAPPFINTLNELDSEESQATPDVQNHLQRPFSQAFPQGVSSEQGPIASEEVRVPGYRKLLGSSYEKVFGRESDAGVKFSAQFIRMRSENTSHDEISKAIAVPALPILDEEMVLNSKHTGSDTVLWRAEERNSPTISKITSATRRSSQGTVVPVETLFNHLFCLFRRSFLQREERVHLELTTLFLKNSRLEGETECENDAKQLISWLERTFTRGHLAKLVQKLVIAIDDSPSMKFLVDRAKSKYNPRNTEMTVLGAFYELMSKQHDAMKTNQDLAKRKQDVDKSIRQAKSKLKSKKIKAPKTTYEKKKSGNNETHTEMEHALIRTFNATKWMLVECTDSHYAYAQSVLEAAKLVRSETQAERDATLKIINDGISALETAHNTPEGIAAALTAMQEQKTEVMQRDMNVVETTVLGCFVETILALGKVTVRALLRTIGKLPRRLALTLEAAGEEIEKVRGIGSGEKPGVEDIVRVAHLVEEEREKSVKQQRIVLKKISYLQECQQLLNGGANPGGTPA